MPRRVALLGSTGTIGLQTLDVIERRAGAFEVVSLAAGRNIERLAEQVRSHRPERIAVADPDLVRDLRDRIGPEWLGEILSGPEGVAQLAASGTDVVVNALVGAAGLEPSLAALRSGATLALANKESLVVGGELLRRTAEEGRGTILPIDSEHSGLFQCLEGRSRDEIARLLLTASGGPFRDRPLSKLEDVEPSEALAHPTWRMGERITVDSATLMNKGFEVIEARWLFDLPGEKIDVWIHPQSLVHALVEWIDGSLVAQVSAADMRLPIAYALDHPRRVDAGLPRCDLTSYRELSFAAVDRDRYPCFSHALKALDMGGTAPAVLNAADEILVAAFLEGRIRFPRIATILGTLLEQYRPESALDLGSIREADRWGRRQAQLQIDRG